MNENIISDFVTRIVDGDTFDTQHTGIVRLIGVDTPELKSNDQLKKINSLMINKLSDMILNKQVTLKTCPVRTVDDYNRTRAIVYIDINDEQMNINTWLLENGFAKVMNVRPCHIDAGRLWKEYEIQAKEKNAGIWAKGIKLTRDPVLIIQPHLIREDKDEIFWIDEKIYTKSYYEKMSKEDFVLYNYYCYRCNYEGMLWTTYDTIHDFTKLWKNEK